MEPDDLIPLIADFLVLRGEDLHQVSTEEGFLCEGFTIPSLSYAERGDLLRLELSMVFDPWPDQVVREQVIGQGPTSEQALEAALRTWHDGSLAVLRQALLGQDGHFLTRKTDFRRGQTSWWLYEGGHPMGRLHDGLAKLEPGRPHWVKVSGRRDDGRISWICERDNRDWPEGRAKLNDLAWPEGATEVNSFLVLAPRED